MGSHHDVFKLVMLPAEFEYGLEESTPLVNRLLEIGLIGEALDDAEASYLVGERFFDHLSFLGCSPNINIAPVDSGDFNFCHIRIVTSDVPVFYSGRQTRIPACPSCKTSLEDVAKRIQEHKTILPGDTWKCGSCGEQGEMQDLNWRKTAAFTRVAVEVWSVHPHEAVPNSYLLGTLDDVTGMKWRYIYS